MNKILAILVSLTLIIQTFGTATLYAQEAPSAPAAPTAPEAPSAPSSPSEPTAPSSPTTPESNHRDRDRSNDSESENSPPPAPTQEPTNSNSQPSGATETTAANGLPTPTQTTNPSASSQPTGTAETEGQLGENRIVTGDADNSGTIVVTGNNNTTTTPQAETRESTKVATGGNGANSTNSTNVDNSKNSATIQDNKAVVNNNMEQSAITGNNNGSGNLGETLVKTGDANVSGTIITAVNTNVDGVAVSEFNVNDDHQGDILLDFASNCITGCVGTSTEIATKGNGANSQNTTTIDNASDKATFQNNDAGIGNTLTLVADSGNNTASENTGGDSTIITGDANVSANALTFANNNIAGNVVYGVVNLYGDLVGDIIFPEEQLTSCCGVQTQSVATTNNGANSTNSTNVNNSAADSTYQTNVADINNTLNLDAQTGDNSVSQNTGGDNRSYTGDANVDANVINVANSNIDGGNMWLVIVNEAGKWVGKILGTADGATMAASEGTTLTTGADGQIIATNGNGANSTNSTTVDNSTNTTTVQNNAADVDNTMNLTANTGSNDASKNTGGDSNIVTGDANIVANMVNFVNNNITGGGKLFVTVVNVFGSWLGDFVTPGQHQQAHGNVPAPTSIPNIGGSAIAEIIVTPTPTVKVNTSNIVEIVTNGEDSAEANIVTQGSTIRRRVRNTGVVSGVTTTVADNQPPSFNAVNEQKEYLDVPEATITPVVASKRIVSINLAWLIFIIPGAILFFALRIGFRKALQKLS